MLLSTSGAGLWDQGFLWLPSLAHPDPWHMLPNLAGLFQFVQTQMMRPANQPKSTDPQQAMMNSVMNFMPLTVVFFGWSFASGPVLYWATQSVYSVVQQWFITGWGNFTKWAPFLPELPEHRRLGYQPPRDLDSVVVVSGDGQPVYAPGPMGWLQRKMDEAQRQASSVPGGNLQATAGQPAGHGTTDAVEVDAVPVAGASGNGSSRSRSRNGKRKGGGKGAASTATRATARTQGRDNGATVSAPAGAVIVPRKAKPVSQENSGGRVMDWPTRVGNLPSAGRSPCGDNRWISGE